MEREQLTHLDLADVQALIERALHASRAEPPAAANPMALYAGRSHAFVRALADELRDRYHDPDIVSEEATPARPRGRGTGRGGFYVGTI